MDQNLNSSQNDRYSSDYQPPRKRFIHEIEIDDQSSYTILKGSDHPTQTIHCRIILVNLRQRFFFLFLKKIFLYQIYLENMVKKYLLIFVVMV